jgi:hypothetical protein
MSKAESAYEVHGVKMRNFNPLDRKDVFGHRNITGFTRTMVFKFDDGSEVEVHQSFKSIGGLMSLISSAEKFY